MLENDGTLQGYAAINNAWGCDPRELRKPTGKEALKACRLLLAEGFRAFGKRPGVDQTWKARTKRKFVLTSGRRRTWPSGGVWYVNPDECGLGFAEIIHSVSHYVHNRVNPGLVRQRGGGHNGHALIEQHLVDFVIKRRWVEDGLKVRTPAPKAPVDVKAKRYASVLARIKSWQTKAKRAETALKKLRRAKARYDRELQG